MYSRAPMAPCDIKAEICNCTEVFHRRKAGKATKQSKEHDKRSMGGLLFIGLHFLMTDASSDMTASACSSDSRFKRRAIPGGISATTLLLAGAAGRLLSEGVPRGHIVAW